ncbi:MAG: hypothetical protein WC657_06535 [Candidatus Paceibacterota bacterium]|jgi:hypothetical protein
MKKPGFISTDKTGINKEAGAKEAMPGFEGFEAYENQVSPGGEYSQDDPAPEQKQDNPDVRAARPGDSISVPDRYY